MTHMYNPPHPGLHLLLINNLFYSSVLTCYKIFLTKRYNVIKHKLF